VSALDRWRDALEAWAIPQEILDAAPESPFGFPATPFRSRGQRAAAASDPTPTTARALEALPPDGSVLDVGCGGGATSLPLVGRAGVVVGVDAQPDMLEGFLANARAAGVEARAVPGRWPDVAGEVGAADVAVAGHVLYNVPDLAPFALALAAAAVRVVLELTERHPLHWMNDLWLRFHGVRRPDGPTPDDAVAALVELGLGARIERWTAAPGTVGFERREEALALVRRRLCLDPSRDDELAEALGARLARREGSWSAGSTGDRGLATIWFDASS
jgi:SAM-dependent methyltransferase